MAVQERAADAAVQHAPERPVVGRGPPARDQTPVAAGDYFAGPSHCLPTGTTARFASGISVYTFLKRSGTVHYREGMPPETIEAIARLAELEGLDAHAASARIRGERR